MGVVVLVHLLEVAVAEDQNPEVEVDHQNLPLEEVYWEVEVEELLMVVLKRVEEVLDLGVGVAGLPLREVVVVDLLLEVEVAEQPHLNYFS